MYPQILRTTASGFPQSWISVEEAASDIAADRMLYGFGESGIVLRGGYNKDGLRSELAIPAIIASRGGAGESGVPALSRATLFARDRNICQFCGETFHPRLLTFDHVLPRSRGGQHCWTNVVAACGPCNHDKDCMTPEEAGMPLLSVPYEPNRFEWMYLANRRVLADQMDFLQRGFKTFRPN